MKPNFTDLVLLIGTNPIPNYVTARYFLDNNENLERVWMVHSEDGIKQKGTGDLAKALSILLKNEYRNILFKMVPLTNAGQANLIEDDIERCLVQTMSNRAQVHLNYTGGTKAMAVHVHRVLEKTFKDRITFSYLDARNFSMKLDTQEIAIAENLRDEINIDLKNLLTLHGIGNPKSTKKFGQNFADNLDSTDIQKLYNGLIALTQYRFKEKDKKADVYRDGFEIYRRLLDRNWNDDKKDAWQIAVKDMAQIEKVKKEFSDLSKTNPLILGLLSMLGPLVLPDDTGENLVGKEPPLFPINNANEWKSFIKGFWLEAYTHWVLLRGIKQDLLLNARLTNKAIDVKRNIVAFKSKKPMELDISLINGYQFCNISCGSGTSKEKEQKLKAFEAIHRANQLGGDESRAVLITRLLDHVEEFTEDISMVTGSMGSRLLVLGCDDLPEEIMWRKLAKHIFDLDV